MLIYYRVMTPHDVNLMRLVSTSGLFAGNFLGENPEAYRFSERQLSNLGVIYDAVAYLLTSCGIDGLKSPKATND